MTTLESTGSICCHDILPVKALPSPKKAQKIIGPLTALHLEKVYHFLNIADITACFNVCKSWRDTGKSYLLWADLLNRDFERILSFLDPSRFVSPQDTYWTCHRLGNIGHHLRTRGSLVQFSIPEWECMDTDGIYMAYPIQDGLIHLLTIEKDRLRFLQGLTGAIKHVQFSGDRVVVSSEDGFAGIWNKHSGFCEQMFSIAKPLREIYKATGYQFCTPSQLGD